MMSRSKGASAPFRIHDIALELARKRYIMYPKIARSAFDPDIINIITASPVYKQSPAQLHCHIFTDIYHVSRDA